MDINILDDPTPPIPTAALRSTIVAEGTRRRTRRRTLTAATVAAGVAVLAVLVPLRLNQPVHLDMTQSPPVTISAPQERPPLSLDGGWNLPLSRLDTVAGETTFSVPVAALHTSAPARAAEVLTARLSLLGQPGRVEVDGDRFVAHLDGTDARAAEVALRRALPRGEVRMAAIDPAPAQRCVGDAPEPGGALRYDRGGCVADPGSRPASERVASARATDPGSVGNGPALEMTLTPSGVEEVRTWQSDCSGVRGSGGTTPGTVPGGPSTSCSYQSFIIDGWIITETGGGSLKEAAATSVEVFFPKQYGPLDLRQIAAYLTTGPLP